MFKKYLLNMILINYATFIQQSEIKYCFNNNNNNNFFIKQGQRKEYKLIGINKIKTSFCLLFR